MGLIALGALAWLSPATASALTCTWNRSTASNFNGSTSYWSCGRVPTTADTVVFNSTGAGNCSITAAVSVISISINSGYTGTVTQTSGDTITTSGNFTQGAGTFAGGDSTIDVGGSFNLSAGTFTSTSGRLEVGGAFNNTGGTFNHNSGRVMLNSTTSQTFASNGATFYDLHINDGLRGYWRLDETASPAVDSSGYGNNLTWQVSPSGDAVNVAPTLFQSSRSLAMVMADRDAALVAMPSNMQMALPITLSAWYRATARDTNASDIISGRDAYVLRLDSAGPAVAKHTGGDVWVELKPTQSGYLDGSWHHVAAVLGSTGGMYLYYDGNLISSNTNTTAIAYNNTGGLNLAIGRHGGANTGMDFGGNIDEVRVYNRALSAAEINSLYIGHQPASGSATHTLTGEPVFARDLYIDSGTLAAGTNDITVAGNWWNQGGVFTGTGTVTFTGTTGGTSNVIRSAGQPFGAITVNQPGRNWTLADRLWAPGSAITITAGALFASSYSIHAGTLTESGTFDGGTGTVVLDSSSDLTFESANFSALRVEDPTESNLVGYWKLDEGQGSRLRDYSGNGNTGTLVNGPKWTTSVSSAIGFDDPAAVTFSGDSTVDDHATMTASGALAFNPNTSHVTVAYWMYYASTPTVTRNAVTLDHAGLLQTGFVRNAGVTYLAAWNAGGGAAPLVSTSSIPAAGWHHFAYTWDGTNSKLYIDGGTPDSTTANAPTSSTISTVWLGTYDGASELYAGQLDDVRIYNRALTEAQIGSLAAGRYAGTGGTATLTMAGTATVGSTFAIDSGSLNTSTFNLTAAASDATKVAFVNAGTLTVGSGIAAFVGGLTVQPGGTLAMATSGGSVRIASTKTLTIDGTLNASSTGATIRNNGSGNYAFKVGSTAMTTPTLNITGLAVKNTDTNGMWINADSSATTTFTRFDNIAFSSGTGTQLLRIYSPLLYLASQGCTFDSGASASTTYSVTLAGDGTSNGETRAVFGGSTCATSFASCQASKNDDDSDNDGVGNAPAGNEAVVQFVRGAATDTAGTIEGFPTAAFDWNTFAYYSTYVTFHDVSGTVDRVYVRSQTGAAEYSWDTPANEQIVGVPRWITTGTTHYLYVATASGKVYRLIDDGASLTQANSGNWTGAANPFDCGCTIVTPLAMNASNLYWGGTEAGPVQRVWTLGQESRAQPMGSPFTITPVITGTSPALWADGATHYLFIGLTGNVIKLNVSNQTLNATNTNPGAASIRGRVSVGGGRVLAADDSGDVWAIDPNNFTGTNRLWQHTVSGDSIMGSLLYDSVGQVVHVGTELGKITAINSSGVAVTGYPITPDLTTDSIRAAPLYLNGILIFGTTTGKLYFYDRTNGSGPVLIRKYYFGPTQSVSGIGYDSNAQRYMVSTADPATKDGRLYFFDAITDPSVPK